MTNCKVLENQKVFVCDSPYQFTCEGYKTGGVYTICMYARSNAGKYTCDNSKIKKEVDNGN